MKYFTLILILILPLTSLAAPEPTVVARGVATVENIANKTLTGPELDTIATRFNESFGSQWYVDANPYDPETEPAEHAAWPGNATANQKATFFLQKMREYGISRLYQRGLKQGGEDAEAAILATAQDYASDF